MSALNIKLDGLSIQSATTGLWYPIPISSNATFNLINLKNIYRIIGNASVPAGTYNVIMLNIGIVTVVVNGATQVVAMPTNSIKIYGNFTVSYAKTKGTNWLNIDINIARSLHQTGHGKVVFLPVVRTSFRHGSTLSIGSNDTAAVTVWGTPPIFYNTGMDLSGLMLHDYGGISGNATLGIADNGSIEQLGNSTNPNPLTIENATFPTCPDGYYPGSDGFCYAGCGGTYCTGDSVCYNDACMSPQSCPDGFYLTTDGYCSPYNATIQSCPDGFYLGVNGQCYSYNATENFCPPGFYVATDGQCYEYFTSTTIEGSCPIGEYLGSDGYCYSYFRNFTTTTTENCPEGEYLGSDGYCHSYPYNGTTTTENCPTGEYLGSDGYCHPYSYNATTTMGTCPAGEYLGSDGYCHSYATYTVQPTCSSGEYLGSDGYCHSYATYTVQPTCSSGEYLGSDGYCHYYATYTVQQTCPSGTYLGSDGYCHYYATYTVEQTCPSGTYYSNGYCYYYT